MLDLYDEFKALTASLEKRGIEYALCGGLAMAVHGLPRATVDIDLLIPSESLQEIKKIANELGYSVSGLHQTSGGGKTVSVDMSAKAITVRLKLASELRRLCLSLGKAERLEVGRSAAGDKAKIEQSPKPVSSRQ